MRFLERIEERPGAAELRAASYRMLGLKRGATCVDVGCGAGYAVAELARKGLEVTGIGADPDAVEAAGEGGPGGGSAAAGAVAWRRARPFLTGAAVNVAI